MKVSSEHLRATTAISVVSYRRLKRLLNEAFLLKNKNSSWYFNKWRENTNSDLQNRFWYGHLIDSPVLGEKYNRNN